MPSAAYYEWIAAGEPYAPALPIRQFVDLLRGKGFTVYHKGDAPHMEASPPEDHTPFSATGWPIASKRWIGHALDIMETGAPIPLPMLARRIIRDKDAHLPGTGWIKYLNWTDEAGVCRHESWANVTATRMTSSSTDKGHIHISARSDVDTSGEVSQTGYDPMETEMSLTPSQEYLLHVFNHRVEGLIAGRDPVKVPAFTASNGQTFAALSTENAFTDAFAHIVELLAPGLIASAVAQAFADRPELLDVLATAVASRIGMIPTAREIAKAIGELSWHGTAEV